ncbi:MAG: tetratricopeptide repeat protein [Chloroflexi bacterium]|nr:tetratricopeptide repeat protein [Chloroflexota bacterium]
MLISRSSPRRPRRRSGCSPFTVLTGALAGLLVIALGWLAGLILPNPQPELVTLDTARRAFDSGDLDDAVEAAEKALAAAPGQPDAVLMLVRGLVYRSYVDWNNEIDRKRALEVATNALLRGGDHPDTLAAQAFALHAAGRYLEAFKAAEKALRANPNHVFARLVYGLAFAGVGSFDRGLIQVQQAAKSADYQVDSLRALAVIQSDTGRYRDAARTIDEAIALNWGLIPLHFERALYALQVGDDGTASTSYLRVLALDPENVKSTAAVMRTALDAARALIRRSGCAERSRRGRRTGRMAGTDLAANTFYKAIFRRRRTHCTAARHCSRCRASR